ncbi:aspartic peptidase A1 [Lactarius hengduanensis]|nr:aspartic peptidase A1 [Lactarius hengduanensis]
MFPTATLTASLLLVVCVAANPIVVRKPPVSLSFARHLNITGTHDLIKKDQARAKNLVSISKAKQSGTLSHDAVVSAGVTNVAVVYQASVGVGSPATSYTLLIDTGSSNTWIGAGKAYVKTSTSVKTRDSVSAVYGSGSFSGTEFTDTVTIGPGLVIPAQSIGVASNSTGFDGFDGILGIGPVDLTLGTLYPDINTSIPTVTDNLFSHGTITSNLVAVSFEPTTTTSVKNGELTFGGTDSTKFTGTLTFIPGTTTFPASEFWGIKESIRYGASTTILSTTAGITRSNRYQTATGGVNDAATGLLRITSAQFNSLQSLFFTTGGRTFELTANAQIWPRALNTFIGVVNDIGSPSGEGFDFINGYVFLERFYSVFDTANKRVGFATTSFTTATTN